MNPKPKTETDNELPAESSLLDEIVSSHDATAPAIAAALHGPVVGECRDAKHPTLVGRALIAWRDAAGNPFERWLPTLQGLTVRAADRVLLLQATNWPEPVIIGVVDGFARRPEAPRIAGPTVELKRDETVQVTTEDGERILEVARSESGPVIRLLRPDVEVELPGKLRVSAESIELGARNGGVKVTATDDVVINGEMIHLN